MHVVLVARRGDRIDALAKKLDPKALPFKADVAYEVQVAALFDFLKFRFGGLDLLFNNADMGIALSFIDSKPSEWLTQIEVSLFGVLLSTYAAIPLLKGRPGSMISTVSTVGGRYGVAGWSVYSAMKFAFMGFSNALRKVLGEEDICVRVIEPGAAWSEFGANVADQLNERRTCLLALTSKDVAQALVYSFAQPPHVLWKKFWFGRQIFRKSRSKKTPRHRWRTFLSPATR